MMSKGRFHVNHVLQVNSRVRMVRRHVNHVVQVDFRIKRVNLSVNHVLGGNSRMKRVNLSVNHALQVTKALLVTMMCTVVNVRKENFPRKVKKFAIGVQLDITKTQQNRHIVNRVVHYGLPIMNGPERIVE